MLKQVRTLLLMWAVVISAALGEHFDSETQQTVMVPMRDGVELATDIYLPARAGKAAAGKFPVLVERTPYNKTTRRSIAVHLARRGYAALLQDCRGRYASAGRYQPYGNVEGKDGFDTLEWAAAQPWSNGRVGSFGGSATGWNQYQASVLRPPHLIGMFVQMAGANQFLETSYPGGTPGVAWPLWILRSAATSPLAAQEPAATEAIDRVVKSEARAWLEQPPGKRLEILREFPVQFQMLEEFYKHPLFDEHWRRTRWFLPDHYAEMKDVPILFVSGWYDGMLEGVLANFVALSKLHKAPTKLIVGPWPHGIGTEDCGDATFGAGTTEDQAALVADWFDPLMGRAGSAEATAFERIRKAPVQIYRMGGGDGTRATRGKLMHGGEWCTVSAWPLPDSRRRRYYLRAGGNLDTAPPADEKPTSFEFDPRNPVPSIGGRVQLSGVPGCIQDQVCSPRIQGCKDALPLNQRPDVNSYSSAALDAPVEVTGNIGAMLWVSSDARDTDFTAKLVDVYPDGYAMILLDGQIRARFREGFDKTVWMKPDEVYPVTIDLGSTSNLFAAGHRIRLDISSSNFPKFEPNPNTGVTTDSWMQGVKARNSVYHDARRASYVELPVTQAH